MNLRHLQIYIKVSETGSMSEAARQLFMTQPAVSQTILDLENELGTKLFERINKKIIQTYSGEVMYNYGRKILVMVDELEKTIKDITCLEAGKLRLGASTTIGIYLLPKIVAEYNRNFNNIMTHFFIENTSVVEEMILNHKIDIGLVEGLVHSQEIESKCFFYDEIYLICSSQHRWIKEKKFKIEPEEIANETLLIRELGSGTREIVEETLKKHHIFYEFTHVLNNSEAIKKAVEENIGISFVSKIAVEEEIKAGKIVKIDLENIKITRDFNIVYHKDKYKSSIFQSFIEHIDLYKN